MKLNYVSVLKDYKTKNRDGGYFIRGELNSFPSLLWFKYFRLLWISIPACQNLCPEPQMDSNEIILHLTDGSNIPVAIEALRSVVLKMKNHYINPSDHQAIDIFDKGAV